MVYPSYLMPHQLTGHSVWIKEAIEVGNACLLIAGMSIRGSFGELNTQAAVSPWLLPQYPYLFSNRSNMLLLKKPLIFEESPVSALLGADVREHVDVATVAAP